MPNFFYKAIDQHGNLCQGKIESESARYARHLLRQQTLIPLEIKTIRSFQLDKIIFFWHRITHRDVELLTWQLANLCEAHLPIAEILENLAKQSIKIALQQLLQNIHHDLQEGLSLANSLRRFPTIFPDYYCASIEAGEQSGHLTTVLKHLAQYYSQQEMIRNKVQQALIYPILVTVICLIITTFLMTTIVPSIVTLFDEQQQHLPWITHLLITLSQFLQEKGIYLIIFLVGFSMSFRYLLKTRWRKQWHHYLLQLPFVRKYCRDRDGARYLSTLGLLMTSHVDLSTAMHLSEKLITNFDLNRALLEAREAINQGISLSLALEKTQIFSSLTLQMISSGENSGKLEHILQRAANLLEQHIERTRQTLLTLFEPFLILVMGSIVLFIVLGVLLPIFSLDISF